MAMSYEIDVPEEAIRDVRLILGDTPELNRLIKGTELSDEKVILAIKLWIQYFNYQPPILDQKFNIENFPSHLILYHGVVIELLKMAGLVHSRNFLNFNDNGVSFTVNDKAGDYLQWIGNFMQTHIEDVKELKKALNAESAYGFHPSPEAWDPYIY